MTHLFPPSPRETGPGWQLLGNLELPVGEEAADLVRLQLTRMLEPLHLHADFLEKILKSAQDSADRGREPNAGLAFGHIHVSVFITKDRVPECTTWGYFRIEKIDSADSYKEHPDHAVEFYLYLEGR